MARFERLLGNSPEPWLSKADAVRELINSKWFDRELSLSPFPLESCLMGSAERLRKGWWRLCAPPATISTAA